MRTIGCFLDLSWPRSSAGFADASALDGVAWHLRCLCLRHPRFNLGDGHAHSAGANPAVAQRQDVGRTVIFIFVIIVACAALFAVAFLIRSGNRRSGTFFESSVARSRHDSAVVAANARRIRTALRHRFYDDSATNAEKHAGGLNFPRMISGLPRLCVFLVRHRHDLPGFRCGCYIARNAAAGAVARILSFGFNTVIWRSPSIRCRVSFEPPGAEFA